MNIPVKAAKKVAENHKLKQVIIFGWDGAQTHIVTYGVTIEDCAQAADGANKIKKGWDWPESTHVEPSRVKKLYAQIKTLENEIADLKLKSVIGSYNGPG